MSGAGGCLFRRDQRRRPGVHLQREALGSAGTARRGGERRARTDRVAHGARVRRLRDDLAGVDRRDLAGRALHFRFADGPRSREKPHEHAVWSARSLSQDEAISNTSNQQNGFFKVKAILEQ